MCISTRHKSRTAFIRLEAMCAIESHADGRKVLEKRQLHKSIIETSPVSSSDKVAGGYHVHVLSDLPEDTDVMLVLTRKPSVPEIVLAGAYMYAIDVHGVISVTDRPR